MSIIQKYYLVIAYSNYYIDLYFYNLYYIFPLYNKIFIYLLLLDNDILSKNYYKIILTLLYI